jgi:hypothetical protein
LSVTAQSHRKVKSKKRPHRMHVARQNSTTPVSAGTVGGGTAVTPKGSAGSGTTKISPNSAPNQSQIDSIKDAKGKNKFKK